MLWRCSSSMLRTAIKRKPQMRTRSSSSASSTKTRGRLPVPPLRQTLDRYLQSLEPFLLDAERRGGMSFSSAYALRRKWVDEFESGIGRVLQERLVALDKVSPYNWLNDNFWRDKAYLEWRAPLLINSNWWLAFADDPALPKSALGGETNDNRAGTTFWQLRRASWLLHRMLQFRDNALSTERQETTTAGSWLLDSVSCMFNIGRIPEPFCDTISEPPPPASHEARSVLVMVHNWCYSMVVYRLPSSENPSQYTLLQPAEIEARLRSIVLDVESRLSKREKAFPVGVLSADERDLWAENLRHLLTLSPTNRRSHQAILHSIMAVSLDNITYTIPLPSPARHAHPRSPSEEHIDSHLHVTRGTAQNVANRFYDKTFTLIVDPSTRAGAAGEHSPVDALVPSIVAEYGLAEGLDVASFTKHDSSASDHDEPSWERLDWVGDDKAWQESNEARDRAKKIIEDSDDSVLYFEKFGSNWIKNFGNYQMSPDAFVQMAMQLAWYKACGEFTATYETVLTRMFKHGRTETLRTFSRESWRWVLSMVDPQASNADRFRLLQDAIASHTRRTREAMTGRGFDRHLLGLRLLLRPLHDESAALFDDELFERSSRWKLSTSGLSAGLLFKGTGFGAVFQDGYGINYLAAPDMIKFGIESKFSCATTSTKHFKEMIASALEEMQTMCQIAMANNTTQVSHMYSSL